jgi:Ca-activated chloride channel homolog
MSLVARSNSVPLSIPTQLHRACTSCSIGLDMIEARKMPTRRTWLISTALAAGLGAATAHGKDAGCTTDTLIVFDASGSMNITTEGTTRIEMARRALVDVLPEITRDRRAGLLTYSGIAHQQPSARCGSITLRVPPSRNAAPLILEKLFEIEPAGLTPLTAAVEQGVAELSAKTKPGVIVLVTDGLETCGRSPCALARHLGQTAKDLVVHVIGFFLGPEQAVHVRCLADETGGLYIPAQTFDEMRRALRAVTQCKEIS